VVRLGDLLEARLRVLVVGVAVGVVLAREFAIGLLDLVSGRLFVDPERLVVVRARCHLIPRARRPRQPAPGGSRSRPAGSRAGRPPPRSRSQRPPRAAGWWSSPHAPPGRRARPRG